MVWMVSGCDWWENQNPYEKEGERSWRALQKNPGGKKRILFVAPDGKRKVIRLGKMPLAQARNINKHKIELLVSSKGSGESLDNEMAAWVRDIPDGLANKLAKAGLISTRENTTVGGLIMAFMEAGTHFKPP